MKTLGEAYLPKNLEQRITDRDKFPNSVREKFKTANPLEKKIQVTVLDTIAEIKKFRLALKKVYPEKIYIFKNDANINYLSEQLCTIQNFKFSTGEQIYEKAEELKAANDTQQLKRVTDLIKAYEKIVEGNYIDNLIKVPREQKQSVTAIKRILQRNNVNGSRKSSFFTKDYFKQYQIQRKLHKQVPQN